MTLKQLSDQYDKLENKIEISKEELKDLVDTLSDEEKISKKEAQKKLGDHEISKEIKDLEYDLIKKQKELDNRKKHEELVKNQREKLHTTYDNRISKTDVYVDKPDKDLKTQFVDYNDNDSKLEKFTTWASSRQIITLLGNLITRKELTSRIRKYEAKVEVTERLASLVIDGVTYFELEVDGFGYLKLFLRDTKETKGIFRFILLPLMDALNDYLGGLNITISNVKNPKKLFAFNPTKQIYVSSTQIKNKPAHIGQAIVFTNLKSGRFEINNIE